MVGKYLPITAAAAALLLAGSLVSAQVVVKSVTYDGPDGDSLPDNPTVDPTIDNDFTRLNDAITGIAGNDTTIELYGTFDLTEANAEAQYIAAGGRWVLGSGFTYTGTVIVGMDSAVINVDPMVSNPSYFDVKGFINFSASITDFTIDNLTFIGMSEPTYTVGGKTLTDVTIQNCTYYLGTYLAGYSTGWGEDASSIYNNFHFDDNTLYFAINSGNETTGDGFKQTIYGAFFNCCRGTSHHGVYFTGNSFLAWADPDMPGATAPAKQTARFICWYDNNNSNRNAATGSQTYFNDNYFDMGLDDGVGGKTKYWGYGIIPTGIDEQIDGGVGSVYQFSGNEFHNMSICFYPVWFNAGVPGDGFVISGGTVFDNCGYSDGGNPINSVYSEFNYGPAIRNATAGAYGTSGGSRVLLDVDTTVDGVTGIPMLNAVANDPNFIEMEPADENFSAFVQAGILAAEAIPAASTTFNRTFDDEWTYEDKWVRPTPEVADGPTDVSAEELAVGYNAFGNAIPAGDPDVFVNDPGDPIVVDINVDTQYAPATIIDKDVTIRRDPLLKFGAAVSPVVGPTVKALTSPLFVVKSGGKLTLQDLTVDGNTPFSGIKDIQSLVKVENGGELVVENCTLKNSFASGIEIGSGSGAATVSVAGSIINNTNPAARVTASTLSISNSLLTGLSQGIIGQGAGTNVTLDGNVVNGVGTDLSLLSTYASLNITDNLFFTEVDPYFNGEKYASDGTFNLDFTGNWHDELYAYGANEANGLITGDVPVVNTPGELYEDKELVAGVLTYDRGLPTDTYDNSGFQESSIVSQFDRDLDALPDAWELANDYYTMFDSDNDGWPDGLEVADGTDPRDGGDFPAGTFDINADIDNNGYADWYEQALLANCAINPFLGDVLRNAGVGLTDAVRSLQIVNGQFPTNPLAAGNLNALNVTGNGATSLANPLQILRYQAGVRNVFPALPGTN